MKSDHRGPIEDRQWPDKLPAHVVRPGPHPRIHGYDVLSDLVPHFGLGEVILTTLRGDAPEPDVGRAFDVAMIALSPMSIAEAPSHAAYLSRLCGGASSSALAVGAIAACEQARTLVHTHEAWLVWLGDPRGEAPVATDTTGETARFVAALPKTLGAPWPTTVQPVLEAAAIGVLWACGLRSPAALEAAFVVATLPAVAAEKEHGHGADIRDYPIDVPRFRYVEDGR